MNRIPIDFVAGSHGHYLETVCNQQFGLVPKENNFTGLGTSHQKSLQYQSTKVFDADHWFELRPQELHEYPTVVSIVFDQEDLLLLSSVSLLRAGDANIDNDCLEENTVSKLLNAYYTNTVSDLKLAYPFLDLSQDSIPRSVLREYFKFGFRNPEVNGYWCKQQQMTYHAYQTVFKFRFHSFYHVERFESELQSLAKSLRLPFQPDAEFYQTHSKFLALNPFVNHKAQCDLVIANIVNSMHCDIPKLSLFQESYINACLENIYHKEMPFHQDHYFTCTRDVLYYLENLAPNL